jgi:hypothetical protein
MKGCNVSISDVKTHAWRLSEAESQSKATI